MITTAAINTILVGVAGGLGAVARYVLDSLIQKAFTHQTPLGTVIINLSGSLLLGLLTGLLASGLPAQAYLIIGTGFIGGYTTFSTACIEIVRLLQERRYRAAVRTGFATLIFAVLAAAAGYAIGGMISSALRPGG